MKEVNLTISLGVRKPKQGVKCRQHTGCGAANR